MNPILARLFPNGFPPGLLSNQNGGSAMMPPPSMQPTGGAALMPGGIPNGLLQPGAYGQPGLPPRPPAPQPQQQPFTQGNWMERFFGSALPYGVSGAMAKLNGWGAANPQGLERWRAAGHIPPVGSPALGSGGGAGGK